MKRFESVVSELTPPRRDGIGVLEVIGALPTVPALVAARAARTDREILGRARGATAVVPAEVAPRVLAAGPRTAREAAA